MRSKRQYIPGGGYLTGCGGSMGGTAHYGQQHHRPDVLPTSQFSTDPQCQGDIQQTYRPQVPPLMLGMGKGLVNLCLCPSPHIFAASWILMGLERMTAQQQGNTSDVGQ